MDKLQLMQGLSKVLGWGDMRATIALPAIEHMINTHIARMAQKAGVSLTPEDCDYLLEWKSDHIFGLLMPGDVDEWTARKYHTFLAVREEIEMEMRVGFTYQEAIEEALSYI